MSKEKKIEINELSDLPHYKEEYDAQLSDMGVESVSDLRTALGDAGKSKKIMDELIGVGPKTIKSWRTLLDVKVEKKARKEKAIVPASQTKPAKKGEEDVEIVEAQRSEVVDKDAYVPKKKPVLDAETKKLLELRYDMSHDRIAFLRQEWFRFPRLGEKWRRPRGMHSKMRRHINYRPNVVSIGYRGPAKVRGLHPSGFQEVMVWNPDQLAKVDPKVQAVRVGGSVGFKKRQAIEQKADELGIRVLNRTG
ncbi:MAG: 50S ribosomal protein L32e [Methanomassiliicoccus sp.]|nr:50S ribosomal protein L32e [Methanomassiliicoccus sp.]